MRWLSEIRRRCSSAAPLQTSPPQKGQRFRGGERSEQDLPRGLEKDPRVLESLLEKLKSFPVVLLL